MESKATKLADSEWEIMKIIWDNRVITANKIIEELDGKTEWRPKTIKAFLSRLLNKQAIAYIKNNREYIYYPLVSESECILEENKSFLNRVYSGSLMTLFMCFLKENNLGDNEIEELRIILDKKKLNELT
jgi:BlaI family transcriptional regulator, penicillinase repressor